MASSSSKDSAIDMADVYGSFRWMEEEEELDLKLYDYHHHLTDLSKQHPRRTRDSFRRTFSLQSLQGSRCSTPASARPPLRKTATDRPGGLSPARRPNHVFSRSISSSSVFRAAPQPSEPSHPLDRRAQYYQDPEARLKLRVYLASPQKFDEAIEFGFPSLEYNDDSNQSASRPSSSRPNNHSHHNENYNNNETDNPGAGTFFQAESDSILATECPNTPTPETPITTTATTTPTPAVKPTLLRPSPSRLSQHLSGGREMTLKMTLTRADLRTDLEPASDPTLGFGMGAGMGIGSSYPRASDISETEHDDPLRLADLPPVGANGPVWEEPEQGGVVKKMWSRLKRRR